MKWTWKSSCGRVKLYLGNCLDVVPSLPTSVLICTDPPWGIGNKNNCKERGRDVNGICGCNNFPPTIGDDKPFDPSHLLRFDDAILWGANHYASRLPDSHFWLCWDRKVGTNSSPDQTDCELAWTKGTSFRTVRVFRKLWAGAMGMRNKRVHPMEKPEQLMIWSIGWFPKSIVVCDPYMGSGSTGMAAVRLGKSFVGCEMAPEYFETAKRRIKNELNRGGFHITTINKE